MDALADIVAALCLSWPAYRYSRFLLNLERTEAQASSDRALNDIERRWIKAGRELAGRWNRTDHRLIVIGLVAFLVSAVLKLAVLTLS